MRNLFLLAVVVLCAILIVTGCEEESVGPEETETNWEIVALPLDTVPLSSLNAISFYDEDNGWIVGDGGNVFATSDGGYTWELTHRQSDMWLFDVCPIDTLHIWAAGMSGTYPYRAMVMYSADSTDSIFIELDTIFDTTIVDEDTTFDTTVIEPDTLYDTVIAWYPTSFDVSAQLTALSFCDAQTGYAVGGDWPSAHRNQTFLHTVDGGETWDVLQCFEDSCKLSDMDFASATSGCIVGASATILTYNSDDMTWNRCTSLSVEIADPEGDSVFLYGVDMVTESVGWCVGGRNAILRTEDGGQTWTVQNLDNSNNTLRAVSFLDVNRGVAVGDGGKVLMTTDGGETWTDDSYPEDFCLTDVLYASADRIMIIAEDLLLAVHK